MFNSANKLRILFAVCYIVIAVILFSLAFNTMKKLVNKRDKKLEYNIEKILHKG